jgi:hypothetical protein
MNSCERGGGEDVVGFLLFLGAMMVLLLAASSLCVCRLLFNLIDIFQRN